ncbi:DMT family transporter [Neisseriaceae bacterium JH1-16]|nr:DMT family transporter [Neisseriaceae bacterium JH1-16]
MSPTSQRAGYLAAFGTLLIWTGFIVISRLGGKSVLTAYDILALRLGTASVLLLLMFGPLPRESLRDARLWLLAVLGGVGYGVLVYAGFKHAPAAHGAILLPGLQPFLIAVIAWWLAGERPGPQRTLGYLLIGTGVVLTAMPLMHDPALAGQLGGDALLLAASMAWALFSVLAKRWAYSPWLLTRFIALGSAILYLPVYFVALPKALAAAPLTTIAIQALYQGIGPTILAMVLFLKAVQALGPSRVSAVIALVPVLAGLAAVPLLGEPLTGWLAAGMVSVSLGALLASRPPKPSFAPQRA